MCNNVKYHLLDDFSLHKHTNIVNHKRLIQHTFNSFFSYSFNINNVNSKKMSVMNVHEEKEPHMNVKQMLLYVMRMHYEWGKCSTYLWPPILHWHHSHVAVWLLLWNMWEEIVRERRDYSTRLWDYRGDRCERCHQRSIDPGRKFKFCVLNCSCFMFHFVPKYFLNFNIKAKLVKSFQIIYSKMPSRNHWLHNKIIILIKLSCHNNHQESERKSVVDDSEAFTFGKNNEKGERVNWSRRLRAFLFICDI